MSKPGKERREPYCLNCGRPQIHPGEHFNGDDFDCDFVIPVEAEDDAPPFVLA